VRLKKEEQREEIEEEKLKGGSSRIRQEGEKGKFRHSLHT